MPYEPIVPPGHHLGFSRAVDGALVGHIFEDGTNRLVGHAPWIAVGSPGADEYPIHDRPSGQGLTPEERAILEAVVAGVTLAIIRALSPHLRALWNEKALPAIRAGWRRVSKADEGVPAAASTSASAASGSTAEVRDAVTYADLRMTTEEWKRRLEAMLRANGCSPEQRERLVQAVAPDGASVRTALPASRELTPRQFSDRLATVLEIEASRADGGSSTEWLQALAPGAAHDERREA